MNDKEVVSKIISEIMGLENPNELSLFMEDRLLFLMKFARENPETCNIYKNKDYKYPFCTKCHYEYSSRLYKEDDEINFCPGCGRKIK